MKKALTLILCIMVAFALLPMCVAAECTAAAQDVTADVDASVAVVFDFEASAGIGKVNSTFTFNSGTLAFTSGSTSFDGTVSATGSTINISDNGDGTQTTYSVTLNFTAKKSGSTQINLTSSTVLDAAGESLGMPTASSTVTVNQQSADCTLKSIKVPDRCTLSPAFLPTVTSYTCNVAYEVDKFPLDWVCTDSTSVAKADGNLNLVVGKNVRTITVTAQSGATKIYTITINRQDEAVPTEAPKLTIKSGSTTYTLDTVIEGEAPEGYEKTTFVYDGQDVECFACGIIRLVQIENEEKKGICVYNTETEAFSKYTSLASSGSVYTVFTVAPESPGTEYNSSPLTIDGVEYLAWTNSDLGSDYHIIYVLNNKTGETYFAVYCSYDGSIQKMMDNLGVREISVKTIDTTSSLPIKLIIAIIVCIVGLIVLGAVVVKKIMDWRLFKAETQDDVMPPDETFTAADIAIFEEMRAKEEAKEAAKKNKKNRK